ncbi:MAG: 4-hydroxy-tetrahydrodipicolinate synthase [Spirochaetia bacterium]|nr:4-hydroxy-tetrahydrodipicolinate synthase [Spirochaetia bacterium]
MNLTGTFTALITPFKTSGEIDWDTLEKIVRFQVENGIEGIVPCGTTGESPTLNHKEHREVIARVTKIAKEEKSDIIIIAGTGSNSTREAVELTRAAAEDGADFALSVNPYYNKPTQEGLYRHFSEIANASKIPIVLYNIPGRTSVCLSIDTIKKLASHENIAGIKEATGDLNFMAEVIFETPDDFALISGDDNLLLPILSLGGRGVISVISNIFPKECGDITRQYLSGKVEGASQIFKRIFPLCKAMFLETNPIPVKFAASYMGLCENILRLPLTSVSKENEIKITKAIENFKADA